MKQFLLLFAFVFSTSMLFSQTLFTYGNTAVSKDEFLRAYNKNKPVVTDKAASLKEYLDLYIKFKLKVKAATDMHLDTLPLLAADLQNFRSQIEEGYLDDENEINKLAQEAFKRSQKDIHVFHLFIPFNTSGVAADTGKVLNEAQEACKELTTTNDSFSEVSQKLNNKSINASSADLGFITVFSLPYQFENIVYQLNPGQVSKPYRTKSGYHIFKNIEERKPVGKITAAQILFALPPGPPDSLKVTAKKEADSVYKLLMSGADFSEVAKNISNDKMTYMNGGVMPEFGAGKFDFVFENKVFSLQKDNDITPPFETAFGYHIVKRLSLAPVSTDINDATNNNYLKQKVKQDDRVSIAKEKFVKEILKKLGYRKNTNVNEKDLWKMTDSFTIGIVKRMTGIDDNTILFSFNGEKVTVLDWLEFAKDYKNASGLYKGEPYQDLMNKYLAQKSTESYRKKLQDYNPEFKYQLKEFKDGNMLFEVMERKVWNQASNDSVGLKNYYNQHTSKYFWELSADAILVTCANEKLASQISEELSKGKKLKDISEENPSQVQTDSGRFELSQIPVAERTNFTEGLITAPVINATDGTTSFAKIIKLYPANQPRSFQEARGLVINDYQNFLEEKWIAELKQKYPVKINESVFKTLLNN